jgi:hypothetical protein
VGLLFTHISGIRDGTRKLSIGDLVPPKLQLAAHTEVRGEFAGK